MSVALILLLGLVLMSLVTFAVYHDDWQRGCVDRRHNRIPEWFLLLLTALLGGPGAYVAMNQFHFKKNHRDFRILVPVLAGAQVLLVVILLFAGV